MCVGSVFGIFANLHLPGQVNMDYWLVSWLSSYASFWCRSFWKLHEVVKC